jgi:transposase-like protein
MPTKGKRAKKADKQPLVEEPKRKTVSMSEVAQRYGVPQPQGAKRRWVHITIIQQ